MTDECEVTVQRILRAHLPIEDDHAFPVDATLVSLGLDSLRAVNLVLDLEETFNIEFPDSMLTGSTFGTVKDLQEALRSLVGATSGTEGA
ncbi:phosphopantetheine-binding protein [Streptosporangium sp. NPDC006013]|uniref:phosphopantetheine-binding protein n=1 Tax=Streptosporangium sp. NPDC006013 TaxID=3155596 RepID=UPI0033A9120E